MIKPPRSNRGLQLFTEGNYSLKPARMYGVVCVSVCVSLYDECDHIHFIMYAGGVGVCVCVSV